MSTSTELENLPTATAMNWVDKVSCIGLLGGTTVSLLTQQVAFATVPFSLILTAQIFSRQQKVAALVEASQQNAQSVQVLSQSHDDFTQNVEQMFRDHERNIDTLTQESNQHNLETITIKERLDEQSKNIAEHAGQLDSQDSTLTNVKEIMAVASLDSQSASAESHFTRGTYQEKLGHLEIAIEDYSQAIAQRQDFAEAYLRRGMAKSELGRKQSAVIDLNLATKHFFEVGDLKNYQLAKEIASKIHTPGNMEETGGEQTATQAPSKLVSINSLFGG